MCFCLPTSLASTASASRVAPGAGRTRLRVCPDPPERLIRVSCVVGIVPFGPQGLERDAWLAGMDPENVKEFEAKLVGKQKRIVDLVGDTTATPPIRARIAGPVVGDDVDTKLVEQLLARPTLQPTARRAVQNENREAAWITPRGERNRPTARGFNCTEQLSHGHASIRRLDPSICTDSQ